MSKQCNSLSLDEAALMAILQKEAKDALTLEGERLLTHMRREIHRTVGGNGPGKPAWRDDIANSLDRTSESVTADGISMTFGYLPNKQADRVRAMIIERGSGSKVGNAAIHAGPTGRSVWDEDVSGKHPSNAKTEYDLPEAFNQQGNEFIENAMRMMQTEFGELTELYMSTTPDSAYYGNVQVTTK